MGNLHKHRHEQHIHHDWVFEDMLKNFFAAVICFGSFIDIDSVLHDQEYEQTRKDDEDRG